MTIAELLSLGRDITVTIALIIALWGAYKGWWVPGWIYREAQEDTEIMRRERDEFKREFFETIGLTRRSVGVAEKTVERLAHGDHLEAEREVRAARLKPRVADRD